MIVLDPGLVRGGAVALSVVLVAAGRSAETPIDHVEHSGEPPAPQEVTRVSEVAWEWEPPSSPRPPR